MGKQYDDLDFDILSELKNDGKLSYRKLAAKLNIHPNTLMQRVKRLEKDKIIKNYTVDIDYEKIGYNVHVAVLIKTQDGRVGDAEQLRDLAKVPQIMSLYGITGTDDVIVFVRAKGRDELVEVLKRIQGHTIVARTNSHIILYTYKSDHDYDPFKGS